VELGGPRERDRLHLSSPPTGGIHRRSASQLETSGHPTPGDWRSSQGQPLPFPKLIPEPQAPSPALTSGVGHDLGLLWADSEREELERDSAFLAVLRGTPIRVAGTGSEDFAMQRPGEPGGRSRSKEKMARGLGICGLKRDQGDRVEPLGYGHQALHCGISSQEGKYLGVKVLS
jgi:hypothetical protein